MTKKKIDNKWLIVNEHNYGGQAKIYIVQSLESNLPNSYALKFLHKQNDVERRKRMYYEVKNLQTLNHSNILNVISSNAEKYNTNEKLYYVCPYISGCTLEDYILKTDITYTQALSFFIPFIDTVNYCHNNNIIHRDIKPDNIMLQNENLNDFILIDFGLSFNIDLPQENITDPNQQLGNRFLLLPELISGVPHEKQTIVSDITQCCGILFYILTKQIPHSLVDGENLAPHHRTNGYNALKRITPDSTIFSNLISLFDKGFSVKTEDRYQSIDNLLADLTSITQPKVNIYGGKTMKQINTDKTISTSPVLKYSQLLYTLNPNPEICNPSGLKLPPITDINELVPYSIALKKREQNKIINYYNSHDFATAAEIIWPRAINILRNRILSLGEEFVADMVETDDLNYVNNLPSYKVICLANDLGFIDNAGKRKLLNANEYYNYFLSTDDGIDEEMPQDEANIIIKSCISYILYNNEDAYGLQFNDFREKLKTTRVTEIFDDDVTMFATCPYFYLKTTIRSLIKLFKESDGIELETITTNLNIIIPQIWQRLKTEEKLVLANAYTDYVNINDYSRTDALNKILLKVQGFDYVKENIRSRTFISVANKLIDTHFTINNFYNEPNVIKTLEDLGTKFPRPALKKCITATLFVKLGNSYNTSWNAEKIADRLLDRLTEDEWIIYLDRYLKEETTLLESISGPNKISKMHMNWKAVIQKYNLSKLNITEPKIKKLLH